MGIFNLYIIKFSIMPNNKINITDLKNLLSRFSNKKFELAERMIFTANDFLFEGIKSPEILNHAELTNTLIYLKNVMERNNLNTLNELMQYYNGKHIKANDFFNKLKEVDPEECFAISFNQACDMYLVPVQEEHKFKNDNLYYLQDASALCTAETQTICTHGTIKVNLHETCLQQEKDYLSHVKGNCLSPGEKKCNSSRKNTDAILSN